MPAATSASGCPPEVLSINFIEILGNLFLMGPAKKLSKSEELLLTFPYIVSVIGSERAMASPSPFVTASLLEQPTDRTHAAANTVQTLLFFTMRIPLFVIYPFEKS